MCIIEIQNCEIKRQNPDRFTFLFLIPIETKCSDVGKIHFDCKTFTFYGWSFAEYKWIWKENEYFVQD